MKKTNEAIFDNLSLVDDMARHLHRLASAAYAMGQDRLSDNLCDIAEELKAGAKSVQVAYSDDLHSELKSSQKAIGETFKVVLDSCQPREVENVN